MIALAVSRTAARGIGVSGTVSANGADQTNQLAEGPRRSRQSRKRVFALAALFSLDSFGGGFVVQSMVALWLYQRFDMPLATTGVIFFWTGLLTAFSFLVAVRIAKRIGLVNTMVYTHIPSSICLILIPFMPSLDGR